MTHVFGSAQSARDLCLGSGTAAATATAAAKPRRITRAFSHCGATCGLSATLGVFQRGARSVVVGGVLRVCGGCESNNSTPFCRTKAARRGSKDPCVGLLLVWPLATLTNSRTPFMTEDNTPYVSLRTIRHPQTDTHFDSPQTENEEVLARYHATRVTQLITPLPHQGIVRNVYVFLDVSSKVIIQEAGVQTAVTSWM